MKKIIFILALFVSFVANSQYTPPTGYTNINARYDWLAGVFRALGLPAGGNAAFTTGQAQRAGSVYYDSTGADAGLKVWNGAAWVGVGEVTQSALDDTAAAIRGDFTAGSGDAYTSVEGITDTSFRLIRDDLTADTIEITGLSATYVDTIFRTPGEDSIRYTKGGVEYAIKDSVGSGGGGSSDFGIIQAAAYTLTSSTSVQKLFDAVANGEITVTANTTYQFECMFTMSNMSASSGNCGFDIIGAGTATATSANWSVVGRDGGSIVTATTSTGMFSVNTGETSNIVAAATTTNMFAFIKGTIRIDAGGTIIPSVNLTNAAAADVGINSYFKLTPIGNGSVTSW